MKERMMGKSSGLRLPPYLRSMIARAAGEERLPVAEMTRLLIMSGLANRQGTQHAHALSERIERLEAINQDLWETSQRLAPLDNEELVEMAPGMWKTPDGYRMEFTDGEYEVYCLRMAQPLVPPREDLHTDEDEEQQGQGLMRWLREDPTTEK